MICRYLPYTLSLRAPAVLAAIEGDPNSTRSLPYVPGSALRGAAARGLGDPGKDAEHARTFRTVILDGSVRFLNAYPRAVGRRTLPTPVSLRIDKTDVGALGEIKAWDLAAFDCERDTDEESWPVEPRSAVPEPFVSIGAAQPLRVQPARGSRIHQQRERSRGRAWKKEHEDGREEAHGAVFAFEFLEGGQEFDGVIQIRGEDDAACDALAASVQGALQAPILLGRSRRSGYGGDATISWGAVREREVEGQGFVNADLPSGTEFRALLTSPYVGRDPDTGQIDATRVEAEIVEALGGRVEVVRRRWSFERVGGFNRKWRLELPQTLACAAGSVLVLRTSARVPRTDLLAVEHAGLGERRVEGFGRAIFLGAPVRKQMLRTPGTGAAPRAPEGDASELVRFAERRILDAAVQRAVEEEAVRLANGVTALPTSSVLGRLRNAMRADPEQALATLRAWLAPEGPARLKRPAMVQLERCRLKDDRSRLSDWLREMAAQEDGGQLAKQLRLETIAQRSSIISEVTANEHLTRRAPAIRSRFVDTALAALARRTRKEKSS
jgi:CRISPR-associated protein Csx10